MTLRWAWLTMTFSIGLIAALALFGCNRTPDGDGSGNSSKTVVSGNVINNNGACSTVIFVNGLPQTVKGKGGSTITVGDTTITFSPDCSTATVVETAEALGSGRLPTQ
jgi:hypothetical protein